MRAKSSKQRCPALCIIISAQLHSTSNNNKHNVIIRFIVDFNSTQDMEQK